jgi:membrane protease YdiL (CAAX protease family)
MSVIRRHSVVAFFLLAYALSWGALPWQSFFAPGVLVAALVVVSATEGWAGLRAMGARLIRWRVSWVWYALALAVPLGVKFSALGLNTALGAPSPHVAELDVWYSIPMAIAINIVNPLNAQLPEESSFRGWAQPRVQRGRSPLTATALMAVGVTLWHLPLFFLPNFGSSPIEAVATVAVTFWYAWLFNHAAGSSLLTLIAHATEGTIETSTLWPSAADSARMSWLYSLVWGLLALVLLVFDRSFWTAAPTPEHERDESAGMAASVPRR